MGYSAGADGKNPRFNFLGDQGEDAPPAEGPPPAATATSPLGAGGDSSASPLLNALRRTGPAMDRGAAMERRNPGTRDMAAGRPMGWRGGYGNQLGGGQQQFYGPPRGPAYNPNALSGGGGQGYLQGNPYAPNPNAIRR